MPQNKENVYIDKELVDRAVKETKEFVNSEEKIRVEPDAIDSFARYAKTCSPNEIKRDYRELIREIRKSMRSLDNLKKKKEGFEKLVSNQYRYLEWVERPIDEYELKIGEIDLNLEFLRTMIEAGLPETFDIGQFKDLKPPEDRTLIWLDDIRKKLLGVVAEEEGEGERMEIVYRRYKNEHK